MQCPTQHCAGYEVMMTGDLLFWFLLSMCSHTCAGNQIQREVSSDDFMILYPGVKIMAKSRGLTQRGVCS